MFCHFPLLYINTWPAAGDEIVVSFKADKLVIPRGMKTAELAINPLGVMFDLHVTPAPVSWNTTLSHDVPYKNIVIGVVVVLDVADKLLIIVQL